MSNNGLSNTVSLIDKYRELEYAGITTVSNNFISNSLYTELYDSSSYDYEFEEYTKDTKRTRLQDTRVLTSMVYQLYEDEYYEFVKEFNEYMEYNEYY